MTTLATLQKIVKVAFNYTPAQLAVNAGLSDHLVTKASNYTSVTSFLAQLDQVSTKQVANWLDSLDD